MRACLVASAVLACGTLHAEDEPSVQQLIAALGSDDADARETATQALIMRGAEAEAALREALPSKDAEVHERVEHALEQIALDKKIGPSAWVNLPAGVDGIEDLFREVARQAHREFDSSQVDLSGRKYDGPRGRMEIWRAIDLLSQAAGCSYDFPFDKRLALRKEPLPPNPVFHQGPLRLVVMGVQDFGAGEWPAQLELEVQCEPHIDVTVGLDNARVGLDAPGQGSLLFQSWAGANGGLVDFHGTAVGLPLSMNRKDLPSGLRLHGCLHALFAQERSEESVETDDRSPHQFHGFGYQLTWFMVDKGKLRLGLDTGLFSEPPVGIGLPLEHVSGSWASWCFRAGSGEVVPLEIDSEVGHGQEYDAQYTCASPPAGPYKLHVSVVTRVIASTLDFDLDNLDLRSLPDPSSRRK